MLKFVTLSELLDNVLLNEEAVRKLLCRINPKMNILGFSYLVVDVKSNSHSILSSHANLYKQYLSKNQTVESPYLFAPEVYPEYHMSNINEEIIKHHPHLVDKLIKRYNTTQSFTIKFEKNDGIHFASFYTSNNDMLQVNRFICNLKVLKLFTRVFYNNFKKSLQSSFIKNDDVKCYAVNKLKIHASIINETQMIDNNEIGCSIHHIDLSFKSKLTNRELQIIKMYASGMTSKEISKSCYISKKTVERHICNVKDKIGCRTKLELYKYMSKNYLLESEEIIIGAG